jgi:hypothetical protein
MNDEDKDKDVAIIWGKKWKQDPTTTKNDNNMQRKQK